MKSTRIFKNDNLTLTECKDGFWLYDESRGMNISMRAKTERDAFIEALTYYERTLNKTKEENKVLENKVEVILELLQDDED